MPELPDLEVYLHALRARILGEPLNRILISSPSLLRTYDPPPNAFEGRRVESLCRVGKRIVWEMEGDLFVVIHLMVSGRLRWRPTGAKAFRSEASFAFPHGTLLLTEASKTKRASLSLLRDGIDGVDAGGIDPLSASRDAYARVLGSDNRTLKRALTDPSWFSGIGNAYSDEILHRARLSPLQRTGTLDAVQLDRLYDATREVLTEWTQRLLDEAGDRWPEKVTAFHPQMAVHGKSGQPCPVCGSPVQRIVYATNETNYCATCQTEGRLLADRARSRFLKTDRPRRIEDL
jgi:formamidopyrimidine-DNA glycosylase